MLPSPSPENNSDNGTLEQLELTSSMKYQPIIFQGDEDGNRDYKQHFDDWDSFMKIHTIFTSIHHISINSFYLISHLDIYRFGQL